jgi:hypothetical protein
VKVLKTGLAASMDIFEVYTVEKVGKDYFIAHYTHFTRTFLNINLFLSMAGNDNFPCLPQVKFY